MRQAMMTRRGVLAGAVTLMAMPGGLRAGDGPAIHVLTDPNCGCCGAWMAILQQAGFAVTSKASAGVALYREKAARGITPEMSSCHTADVEGYVIEGHVPVADIRRLLAERPDALGLAVPGMPYGSPGMGPEDAREAYDVMLMLRDGTAEVFTSYPAA